MKNTICTALILTGTIDRYIEFICVVVCRAGDGYSPGTRSSQVDRSAGSSSAYTSRPANQYNASAVAGAQPQRGGLVASGRQQNPSNPPQASAINQPSANTGMQQRAPYIPSVSPYMSLQVVYSHCLPSFSAPRNWGTKGSFRCLSGYWLW